MAFENVDVNSLRNSLNSCRNSIDFSSGKEFVSNCGNFWHGSAKENLTKSMNILYNDKYKRLDDKLVYYLSVCDIIDVYKQVQAEIEKLRGEIASLRYKIDNELKPKLYYTERIDKGYFDEDGKWVQEWEYEERIDQNVQNQINYCNALISQKEKEIKSKENRLAELESKVNSMV